MVFEETETICYVNGIEKIEEKRRKLYRTILLLKFN